MDRPTYYLKLLLISLVVLGLSAGCNPQPAATQPPVASTPVPDTQTPLPATNTALPPTYTSIPPTHTLIPPTNTLVPPTPTNTLPPPSPTAVPPFVFVRIFPADGSLADQLAAETQKAIALGFSPVVFFDAEW